MTTSQQLGKALAKRRENAGNPSYETIARGLIPIMGADFAPTSETVRAYHLGKLRRTIDLEIATGLATYYGCSLAELCPPLADEARRRVLLLVGERPTGPGGGTPGKAWTPSTHPAGSLLAAA